MINLPPRNEKPSFEFVFAALWRNLTILVSVVIFVLSQLSLLLLFLSPLLIDWAIWFRLTLVVEAIIGATLGGFGFS